VATRQKGRFARPFSFGTRVQRAACLRRRAVRPGWPYNRERKDADWLEANCMVVINRQALRIRT